MKNKKKIIESLLFLIITILLMISSTFAWLTIDSDSKINDLIIPVGKYEVDIRLYISRNESEYLEMTSTDDVANLLMNSVPGDTFDFRITLINKSTSGIFTTIKMGPILSQNINEGYDMRDVFYIDNGIVNISTNTSITLTDGESYHLIDLIDNSNNLYIANKYTLPLNETVSFEFRLIYDSNTSDINYQEGELKMNTITIYFNI